MSISKDAHFLLSNTPFAQLQGLDERDIILRVYSGRQVRGHRNETPLGIGVPLG